MLEVVANCILALQSLSAILYAYMLPSGVRSNNIVVTILKKENTFESASVTHNSITHESYQRPFRDNTNRGISYRTHIE